MVIGCVAEEAWRSVCVDDDGTNRCGSKVMPIWPRLERRMCQRAPQSLFLLLLLFIISSPEANTKSTRPLTHHDTMQTSSVAMAIPAMMAALQQKANHSWLQQLRPDPQQQKFIPNRTSRQVFSGHFVEVAPMPLPQPSLVIHRRGSPSRTSPVLLNRLTRVAVQRWLQSSTSTMKPWGLTCSSSTSRATATRLQVAVVLMVVAVAVVVIGPDSCVMSPSGTAVHCCNCRHALLGHSICPQHHGHRNGIARVSSLILPS